MRHRVGVGGHAEDAEERAGRVGGQASYLAELCEALRRDDDTGRIVAAGRALIGRGPGLTPSGDDVLCGALLARHATGRPVGALAAAVAGAEERTPLVSAALLRHAVRGECIPQVADAIRGLAAREPLPLAPLLAVGHHSGADLVRGIAAGLA
ncbi:DUF2877 domain-containing protein [Streptomyces sp. MZ04]|uniref:DUF2877 domain-containing protein n=1 Tax=Streptomyces sp. MZ04 TaxID=2559236 RepID=UPI00143318EB|nr:DUF2877 domain-containing protein [Streptomyces sp. MZ04]